MKIYKEEVFIQMVSTWPEQVFVVTLFSETHPRVPLLRPFRMLSRVSACIRSLWLLDQTN